LRVVSDRVQRRFCDRAAISLEAHVARLQATVATVELHERPEHLDRLAVLRDQVFTLNHLYPSLFGTAGWILRLAVTIGLLVSINPALALLAVFAVPTVLSSSWRSGVERIAEERGAPHQRLARHLFTLGTTASPGKEVRVTGVGPLLIEQRRAAWEGWYASVAAARWSSAVWHIAAWALFGFAYVGAVIIVAEPLRGSPGDVLLIVAAGGRLSQYIGATVGEIGFLRGVWLDASRRLLWLEQFAAARRQHADHGAGAAHAGHPLRERLLPLSRNRADRAGGDHARPAGRKRRGGGWREWRRQEHARQAALRVLSAYPRLHHDRRPGT
jgi:ATP-binding cassette subfamily B protein